MEASLLALGITLYAAALVPLTAGRFGRGAALAYLATVAWGAGAAWSLALLSLAAFVAAGLVYLVGIGLRLGHAAWHGAHEN